MHNPSEIKQMYKCQDCTFSTYWPTSLRRHEKLYHNLCENNQMCECPSCTFVTYWVRRHKKFMHNPSDFKEMYECRDCTYSTNLPSNLRRHEKFKHNPNDLRKHEKAKHNPLVTEYHCTINVTAMKNEIMNAEDEYQKKLALGREI